MNNLLTKQLDRFLSNNPTQPIRNICSPLNYLGISGFYYTKVYNNGAFLNLTSNIDMAEYCFKKFYNGEYSLKDIEFIWSNNGMSLWELNKNNKLLTEFRALFNVGNACSMSFTNPSGYRELFFYYSDINNCQLNDLYLNHIDVFKNFFVHFKEKAKKLIQISENHKITIPEFYRTVILKNSAIDPTNALISQYYSHLDTHRFYIGHDDQYLTYREAECLYWYTNGMSVKSTAETLHVSAKTVANHIDHSKIKLVCSSKTLLTKLLLDHGIHEFFKRKQVSH